MFSLFVTTQIFLWYPADVWSDSGRPTLRNGHGVFALSDNSRPTRPSGPMVSLFVTIQIFLWYTADIRSDSGCPTLRNGHGIFCIIGQLVPNSAKCSDVFPFITFHLSFFQIYFIVALPIQLVILAEAPVYKFRLGRPSRLPRVFINFETDPCLCPHPQKHYFLIPTSPNLWHPTPLGRPFGRPLGHPLRHLCLSSTIQPSTIIHLLSPILPTPLTVTSLGPHPSGSALDVRCMSALRVMRGSEPLVTHRA